MRPLSEAPFVDIFSDEFRENPGEVIAELQLKTGVTQTAIGAMVIHRDLVQRLLTDRRLRSSVPDLVRLQGITEGPLFDLVSSSILAAEGEAHGRLRKLVNRAFTPRAVDPHRPVMRDILGLLVDKVVPQGRCDFVTDIADHYPILVMCHLLGVPDEDHGSFAAWNKAVTWVLSLELSTHIEEARWGSDNLRQYVQELIEDRRRQPRDDMITTMVQADEAGDRLSDQELRSLIGALLFAGFDTTRNQLGLAMFLFAEHPDQWALLTEQPELVPQAVDEVMRVAGAVSATPRMTLEEVEADGYTIPAGTLVSLGLASANADPRVYANPLDFDITVTDREPHLTFGAGPHYCLGANLAKAEMQEALTLLSQRMPVFALDGEPEWRTPYGIYGPEHLPLCFG